VPDDVRALESDVSEQRCCIGGLFDHPDLGLACRRLPVATAVVPDEAITLREDRLGHQRLERVGDERAMDEQDGIARSAGVLIREVHASELNSFRRLPQTPTPRFVPLEISSAARSPR